LGTVIIDEFSEEMKSFRALSLFSFPVKIDGDSQGSEKDSGQRFGGFFKQRIDKDSQ